VVLFDHIHHELSQSSQQYTQQYSSSLPQPWGPPAHADTSVAAAARHTTSIHRTQQQQEQREQEQEPDSPTHYTQQHTPHKAWRSSARQSRRALRRNRARAAALRRTLGRASYTLAALSASGLTTQYLSPVAELSGEKLGDVTAALCQQLAQAAAGLPAGIADIPGHSSSSSSGGSLSSDHGSSADGGDASSSSCQIVVSSDPRVLRELQWLLTAATAGTMDAQLALADRWGCTALQYNVLYCTVLCSTGLDCTVQYCTVLHLTAMHWTGLGCGAV
jgi:hypothetical protein